MEQRQPRLGDILDDYCPRERRVTNHAVVAMVGADVKQTRCTTCDAEHEYRQARVPRQRRKPGSPAALYAQVAAGAPKRVAHEAAGAEAVEPAGDEGLFSPSGAGLGPTPPSAEPARRGEPAAPDGRPARADTDEGGAEQEEGVREEGPVHRPLIRASLPRPEGQQPPARPIPEFTIRQPAGRPGRPAVRRGRLTGRRAPPTRQERCLVSSLASRSTA